MITADETVYGRRTGGPEVTIGRILLVSDDERLAARLRADLTAGDTGWAVEAYSGGYDALARLDGDGYTTLVVDGGPPDIDTTELLVEARRRHPLAARVVLAAGTDIGQLIRLAPLAHRVLPKPCDPAEVVAAVCRSQSLRELLQGPGLAAVVGRIASIPTLSTLYTQIAEQLSYPDFSLAAVGDLVGQDVGIAAKVIQMANSALVGLRRPSATPSQAVRVLGAELTRTLVLAADLFSRYDPAAIRPFSIDALWDHSRRVAEMAGMIAASVRGPDRTNDRTVREATLSGLLHDIGRLLIASQLPGPYKEVLGLLRTQPIPVAEAERQVLGASHAEVGGYLLGLWGLPDAVIEAVVWHHRPSGCPGNSFTALTAVHVAEALVSGDESVTPDLEYLVRIGVEDRLGVWAAMAGRRHPH